MKPLQIASLAVIGAEVFASLALPTLWLYYVISFVLVTITSFYTDVLRGRVFPDYGNSGVTKKNKAAKREKKNNNKKKKEVHHPVTRYVFKGCVVAGLLAVVETVLPFIPVLGEPFLLLRGLPSIIGGVVRGLVNIVFFMWYRLLLQWV